MSGLAKKKLISYLESAFGGFKFETQHTQRCGGEKGTEVVKSPMSTRAGALVLPSPCDRRATLRACPASHDSNYPASRSM